MKDLENILIQQAKDIMTQPVKCPNKRCNKGWVLTFNGDNDIGWDFCPDCLKREAVK